jgi:hypothetical protein
MSQKWDSDDVVGIYCFTYPEHEGKAKRSCDHCVQLIPKYLTPEVQAALSQPAQDERWDKLSKWLEVERTKRMVVGSDVRLKMDELESSSPKPTAADAAKKENQ